MFSRYSSRRGIRLFAVLLALTGSGVFAAEVTEYQLKAEFIERFTRFIDWPAQSAAETSPFVICVFGNDPFGPYLRTLAETRRIKGRSVVVRQTNEEDLAGLADCDLVFIAASQRKNLSRILAVTSRRPILTIGDGPGFAEAGVLINFYNVGDRVRFEVNSDAAEQSGLRIGSKLMKLAKIVEGEN
jgi:hypothetical protein